MAGTASPAALDTFMSTFRSQVDSGFGLIQGDVQGVFTTLVIISVAITAILWAIDENQNVLAALVRKTLLVGFFYWLLTNWHTLSETVVSGFATLGLKASGSGMSVSDFLNNPSKTILQSLTVVQALLDYCHHLAPNFFAFFANLETILIALIAALGVLIAFILLGIEIAVTVIEFHIVTLVALVTVPFGVLTQTSFMSERAIGYVVSVGLKVMALAIVVGIGTNLFSSYTVSAAPDIYEDCGLLLSALVLLMLALKIPAIASALISGGPQLSSGSALAGAAGLAAGVAGVGLAGRAAGAAISGGWAHGGKLAAAKAASSATSGSALPGAPIGSGGGDGGATSTPGGGGPSGGGGGGAGAASRAAAGPVVASWAVNAAETARAQLRHDRAARAAGQDLASLPPVESVLQAGADSDGAGPSSSGGDGDAPASGAGWSTAAAASPIATPSSPATGSRAGGAAQAAWGFARAPVSSAIAYGRAAASPGPSSRNAQAEDAQAARKGQTEDLQASSIGGGAASNGPIVTPAPTPAGVNRALGAVQTPASTGTTAAAVTEDRIAAGNGASEDAQAVGNASTEDLIAAAAPLAPNATGPIPSPAATVARARQRRGGARHFAVQAAGRAASSGGSGGSPGLIATQRVASGPDEPETTE